MDGIAAAAVVKLYYDQHHPDEPQEFVSAQYGEEFPWDKVIGHHQHINIVDFSYPRKTLEQVRGMEGSPQLCVMDHHKSQENEIADLDYVIFDTNYCGAVLALMHFFPGYEVPKLLKYVEDRDLWKWELNHSKEVSAYSRTFLFDIEAFTAELNSCLKDRGYNFDLINHAQSAGEGIVAYQNQCVQTALSERNINRIQIGGYDVPAVNCTMLQSEIIGELAKGEPFAAGYFDVADKRIFSLRSREDGEDVSEIAKQYGGGGHPGAAGFTVAKPDILNREDAKSAKEE